MSHTPDTDRLLRVGIAAAYKGAEVLRRLRGGHVRIREKGRADLVTEADTGSEAAIIDSIRGVFPDHAFLAEESGAAGMHGGYRWIVDPLDGTTNFAHGIDLFCISIAVALENDVLAGIVLNPVSGELFSAARDRGARLNGQPIRVSKIAAIENSLLATGFPYNFRQIGDPVMRRFSRCAHAAQGIRRLGAAALDLCFLACGRFEAFWEQNLQPWDTAAGSLIAREAGARLSDFSDEPFSIENKEILATNGRIHEVMLELLRVPNNG
jgi:myo-inositol-1(or 4)-monophosphatase